MSKQHMFWSGFCGNIKLKNTIPNHENPKKTKQWYLFHTALMAFIISQQHVLDIEGKTDKSTKRVTLLVITYVGNSINGYR